MDFEKVLYLLSREFERNKINYGLIGGFSLAAWGVPRTTMDLDFLVAKSQKHKVQEILEYWGYELVYETEEGAQFVGKIEGLGEVDFLYAQRPHSMKMLARSEERKIDNITVKVLIPEDIIGLLVQAMANDPDRKYQSLADIQAILDKYHAEVDWNLIKEYFHIFGLDKIFSTIRRRYEINRTENL